MENKKELYKTLKKEGIATIDNYNYIIIDKQGKNKNKKIVFKGYDWSYIDALKYEFYGVCDDKSKNIYTLSDAEELQKKYIEEAKTKLLDEVISKKDYYKKIQLNNFNKMILNDTFKNSFMYYYLRDNNIYNFNRLFITNKDPEELQKELYSKIIYKKNSYLKNEDFLNYYMTESEEEVKKYFYNEVNNIKNYDAWDFNYNYNNDNNGVNLNIEFNYNNFISLLINKYDYIIDNYKKIFNDPSDRLLKIKKMYLLCNDFYNKNNNKTCTITLKGGDIFKIDDFNYLLYILEYGLEKGITYRLLTTNNRQKLKEYNFITKNLKNEDDIFPEDIIKIEFSKKTIYSESEA